MVIALLVAAAVAATQPSPRALALGRELAHHGTLAAILPLMKEKEIGEMVAAHKELSAAEQARLRQVAERVFDQGRERLLGATGREYAARLNVADLAALVAFYRSPAAARFQQVMPQVIGGTMAAVGTMDFKGDVAKAFCAETGKICPVR